MSKAFPKVTIGVLSWNRFHYLKATLESARECIGYPNLEWIVSDNESTEPGLRDYLESLDWVDHKLFKTQSHADAMNELVQMALGEFIVIWPEDVQFTVRGDWMKDVVEILGRDEGVGSMCLDYMRRVTIRDVFRPRLRDHRMRFVDEVWRYRHRFRRPRRLSSSRGFKALTMGWTKPGVCGSGIPSITRTALWRELGPWRTRGSRAEIGLIDSSLGAEEDMIQRFYASNRPLQGAIPLIPVAADIITDPSGCKAKVRKKYRYGVYMPPPQGTFYYRIRDLDEFKDYPGPYPMDFTSAVTPQGFHLPLDENGDRRKAQMNTTVVYDLERNVEVKYPLLDKELVE